MEFLGYFHFGQGKPQVAKVYRKGPCAAIFGFVRSMVVRCLSVHGADICHMSCWCLRGLQLWVDLTHWYGSVYEGSWENVSGFLARMAARWQATVAEVGCPWSLQRGAQPKAALASLWVLIHMLCCARSLSPKRLAALLAFLEHLWQACRYSGILARISFDGSSHDLVLTDGCVDFLNVAGKLFEQATAAHLAAALTKANATLERVSFPTLALIMSRVAALRGMQSLSALALQLGMQCTQTMEEVLLARPGEFFQPNLPEDAPRYAYRCGASRTHADPRAQVAQLWYQQALDR